MRDRTKDFQNLALELTSIRTSTGNALNDVLSLLERISTDIQELQGMIRNVESKQRNPPRAFDDDTQKIIDHRENIEKLNDECNRLAMKIRNQLKNAQSVIQEELTPGSADYRMAMNQYYAHSAKMRDIIINYQQSQDEYFQRQRARFEREYKIVNPSATPFEIEEVMNNRSDFNSDRLFADHILRSTYREEATNILKDVKSRHQDIAILSKQIEELALLYSELDELVNLQNTSVESISQHVEEVKNYSEAVNTEMASAIKTAAKVRRRKWCLSALCLVLIAALVVVIILVVVPAVKKSTG